MKLLDSLGITAKLNYLGGDIALTAYEKKIQESKLSASQKKSTQYIINEARRIIAQ